MEIKLYKNTGFTDDNIPDRPSLLGAGVSYESQDLVQILGLDSIRVFCSAGEATYTDYISIQGIYYKVRGYRMLDAGTAEFALELDAWTTLGGVDNMLGPNGFNILDGITERVHIRKADDNFGSCPTEDDPLLVPARPLEICMTEPLGPYNLGGSAQKTIVESALNLGLMGYNARNNIQGDCYTYVDSNNNEHVIPMPIYIDDSDRTTFKIGQSMTQQLPAPGTAYWDASDADVKAGLEIANGLGLNSAIVSSFVLPNGYNWTMQTGLHGRISGITGYYDPVGSNLGNDTDYLFNYATVNNKRVLLGDINKYTIQSISTGEKAEFRPEDLFHTGTTYPQPWCAVDPRSTGRPYYRFRYYKNLDSGYGGTAGGIVAFFQNAVKGMTWQECPQVYYKKEGNLIDNLNYQVDKDIENYNFNAEQLQLKNALRLKAREFITMETPAMLADRSNGAFTDELRRARAFGTKTFKPFLSNMQSNIQRDKDFALNNRVVAPTINFPLNESMRDFVGNGCIAYRVHPGTVDLNRMDKLLTMYGYKLTKPLEMSDLTNRSKFNYVQAKGVTLAFKRTSGAFSNMQIANALSAQLEDGVRIWHENVNPAVYTDGTNI